MQTFLTSLYRSVSWYLFSLYYSGVCYYKWLVGCLQWKGLSASLMRGTLHNLNKMWVSLTILLCKGGHSFENNVEYLMVLSRQNIHTHTYCTYMHAKIFLWSWSHAVSTRTWGSMLLHSFIRKTLYSFSIPHHSISPLLNRWFIK